MATTQQKLEQGARSREALLAAAIELIADGGYNATGVDAIARRAGVVKSALYWHFTNKDGLLVAALERAAIDWVTEIEHDVAQAGETPEDRLTRLLDRVRGLFLDRPERLRLMLSALLERGAQNDEVRTGVNRILHGIRATVGKQLAMLLPAIPPHRVEGTCIIIVDALAGAFIDSQADPNPQALELRLKLIRKMVQLWVTEELRMAGSRGFDPVDEPIAHNEASN